MLQGLTLGDNFKNCTWDIQAISEFHLSLSSPCSCCGALQISDLMLTGIGGAQGKFIEENLESQAMSYGDVLFVI